MKLLKILLVFFLIYFIRRFIQFWKVMKGLENQRPTTQKQPTPPQSSAGPPDAKVVDAEFKVLK